MKIYAGQATGSFAVDGALNVSGSIAVSGLVDGIDLQELSASLAANKASVTELSEVSGALALSISNISTDFADITNKPALVSSSLQFNTLDTPFTGSFTGSFYGDGSNLSGVTSYTDADTLTYINSLGVVSSSAQINTGSFSGSFTGEFTGDGSGLTNLPFNNSTTASFALTSSITVEHGLGSKSITVDVYDSSDILIIPQQVTLIDNNNVKVDFAGETAGHIVISKGGHIISGSIASQLTGLATTGSNNFIGDQTITGSLVTSGSKVEFNVAWPAEGSEQHIIKTEPFVVNSPQGLKPFSYGAFALEHHTEDGGYEHNAFKLYMYDNHTSPSYGSELLIGPVRAQMTINASGSNALGNISTQDVGDGTTRTLLYGNTVQLGAVLTDSVLVGNATAAVEISGSSIGISGSTTIAGDLDVTGKITAQEFHTEYVSSSIVYQSGSTKFGDTSDDIHQFTGSVAVTGGVTGSVKATGHIIPSENNLFDLGTPTNQFRHLYLSTASLYMDGTKILSSNADVLTFTTDVGQSIKILETGLDDITLQTDAGNIELKGTVEIASGKKIIDSAGTVIQFGDSLGVSGSIQVSGTVDGIDLQLMSSSLATRVSDVELFSSSLSSNFATDAELSAVSGALALSISSISTDFADITNKPALVSSSAQFTDATAPFTGSFSGSFFGDGSNLSGVTSYTDADTLAYINSLNVVSGSFTTVSTVSDTFTSATSHTVTHNFGTKEVIVSVYENDILIFPSTISTPTENTVTITFPEAITGRVVVVKAGHIVSGSIEFNNVLNKPTLISSSAQIAADISGSFRIASSSLAQRISVQEQFSSSLNSVFTTDAELSALSSSIVSRLTEDETSISSLNSATASYLLNTTDTLVGDLTVTGKVTAQEFYTEYVSSSIVFQSGSTKFGDTSDDTHLFTGSVSITGTFSTDSDIYTKSSLRFNGAGLNATDKKLYSPADGDLEWMTHTSAGGHGFAVSHQGAKKVYLNALGSSYFIGGNVGIGTSSPDGNLHVYQSTTEGSIRVGGGNGAGNSRVFIQSSGASSYIDSYGNSAYQNLGIQALTLHLNSAANTGNVGIGTLSAPVKLTVGHDGHGVGISYLGASSLPSIAGLFTDNGTNGGNGFGDLFIKARTDYAPFYSILFQTAEAANTPVTRMAINPYGKVGIGTTTPFSGAELDVYGDLVLGQQNWAIRGNNANADIGFEELAGSSFSDANYRLYLQSGGNVGIGTTSPQGKLDVIGDISYVGSTNNSVFVVRNDGSSIAGGGSGTSLIVQYGNQNIATLSNTGTGQRDAILSMRDEGVVKVRIAANNSRGGDTYFDGGGNVGIGTTSPTHKVHINSTADNAYALRVQGNTNNVGGVWTGIGIAGEAANTKAAILFEDIGSSYSRGKLHLAVNNAQDQSNATVSDARLTVTNGGNVGIGTTSPERKLSVEGSVRVGRATLGWYESGSNAWDGYAYLHLKTNLDGGGSGNVEYTMSLFRGRYYSYSAEIREGSLGFHNWSGNFYSTAYTGNFFAAPYMSSDGKVVLVVNINYGNHLGVTIDWYQAYPYPLRESIVTAVSPSNSSSGVY